MYMAVGDDLWQVVISPGGAIEEPTYIGQITDGIDAYFVDGLSFDDNGLLWALDNAGNILRLDLDGTAEKVSTLAVNEVTGSGAHSLAISNVDPGVYVVLSDATNLDGSQDRDIHITNYLPNDLVADTETEVNAFGTTGTVTMSDDGVSNGAVTISQTSDVENVFVQSDADANITVNDFTSVDAQVRGHESSTIVINGAERGSIDMGEGDDSVVVNAATASGGLDATLETFNISTDGGNDTISLVDLADTNYIINAGEYQDGTELLNDPLAVTDPGDLDTLEVDGDIDLGAGNLTLSNFEVLDITGTGDNTVTLLAADVISMTDSNDTLVIEGNAGDSVTSSEAWTANATQVYNGITYNAFDNGGGTTLLVNTDVDTTGII